METTYKLILEQLQEYAQLYFAAILDANTVDGKCHLRQGKYSAKEINSYTCGMFVIPCDEMFDETVELTAGSFRCKFQYRQIFKILDQWESMSRAGKQKAVFEIGDTEEKNAKILLDEKTVTGDFKQKGLRVQKVCGNWWMPRKLPKNGDFELYYELKGVMFIPGLRAFSEEDAQARSQRYDDERIYEMLLSFLGKCENADNYDYFKEVAVRAGIDLDSKEAVRIIETARKEAEIRKEELRKQEEAEKIRREQAKREQMEREAEEERHYKESQQRAREKFISGKMISLHEFEMTAELVGYQFNIRTLGTLRKRVSYIEIESDGTPTVYGTKKRSGLDGTFAAIREVYELAKAMPQEEPKQPATPTETPQISTETAVAGNVPICELYDNPKANPELEFELDAGLYYEWMKRAEKGKYRTIAESALIEALTNIFLAAHRRGEGHVLAMNERGELVDTVFVLNNAPQSPETPQIANSPTYATKRQETPHKQPKRTIRISLIVQHPIWREKFAPDLLANVRKTISTPTPAPPGYAPPIRGDCKIGIFQRAKPPDCASYEKINIPQLP